MSPRTLGAGRLGISVAEPPALAADRALALVVPSHSWRPSRSPTLGPRF